MCGIFSLLNNNDVFSHEFIETQFYKGKGRGPESSKLTHVMVKALFGFHRLAINGLNDISNQPIIYKDIALICNGEIYNYKDLYKQMGYVFNSNSNNNSNDDNVVVPEHISDNENENEIDNENRNELPKPKIPVPQTQSDCEVIIHLYLKYGMEHTLQMLDGVFAFVLVDYRLSQQNARIYVARDPYGVRPLYIMKTTNTSAHYDTIMDLSIFGFASELKMLNDFTTNLNQKNKTKLAAYAQRNRKSSADFIDSMKYTVEQFMPGTYSLFEQPFQVCPNWMLVQHQTVYHKIGFYTNISLQPTEYMSAVHILSGIRYYLTNAVEKRCSTTERPIACLLSGGLDSSLITALVMEYRNRHGLPPIETYSIGLAGSTDLAQAKIVADYLGTKHTEIVVTEEEFIKVIPEVIYAIESYDTTSVRASIGNWLLGKYIREHSEAKVIFNGDGSDELTGGYLYMGCAPDAIEFDKECRRLLADIHAFDVLRSDKSISCHGLEPRTPFLDRAWTQYYMSIPADIRFHKNISPHFVGKGQGHFMEKQLIRTAFSRDHCTNIRGEQILPDSILWRRKEAFSDGVSQQSRSLYQIIQDDMTNRFIKNELPKYPFLTESPSMVAQAFKVAPEMSLVKHHLIPKTTEQYFYRLVFETYFPGMGKIVPYFWMPRYIEAEDASARTLDIYTT